MLDKPLESSGNVPRSALPPLLRSLSPQLDPYIRLSSATRRPGSKSAAAERSPSTLPHKSTILRTPCTNHRQSAPPSPPAAAAAAASSYLGGFFRGSRICEKGALLWSLAASVQQVVRVSGRVCAVSLQIKVGACTHARTKHPPSPLPPSHTWAPNHAIAPCRKPAVADTGGLVQYTKCSGPSCTNQMLQGQRCSARTRVATPN